MRGDPLIEVVRNRGYTVLIYLASIANDGPTLYRNVKQHHEELSLFEQYLHGIQNIGVILVRRSRHQTQMFFQLFTWATHLLNLSFRFPVHWVFSMSVA